MPAPCPCINYPFIKNFRSYFTINLLTNSFLGALLFSTPIFFDYFDLHNALLSTFFVFLGLYLLIRSNSFFFNGFFLALIWFWWIGLSFRYYDLKFLVPFVPIVIATIYGAIFAFLGWILRLLPKPFAQATILFTISYIHPFGFNWLIPEVVLTSTLFGVDKLHFLALLLALLLPHKILKALLLITSLLWMKPYKPLAPLDIELVTTHIPQEKKWQSSYRPLLIQQNFAAINKAIKHKKDLVVLPESAFALFLNREPQILLSLLELSHKITIVTGALSLEQDRVYNATFVFHKGRYIILKKVVLVPFGEEIPLPKPIANWINDIFFDGASDYAKAKVPQTYTIENVSFTNAICYEATHPIIYQTNTPYIIALSNNAWFLPSYEPNLQNLIIKYYATIYNKVVYHATNIAKTEIIR